MVRRWLVLASLAAVTGCGGDTIVVAPTIDTPSGSTAFIDSDEIVLSVALAGSRDDLVAATFQRGETLELPDVPFGENLVIHMIGQRTGGSEVAAGRTCVFPLRSGEPPPAPHLYFASTVTFADAAAPPTPVRLAGLAMTYRDDGSGIFLGGEDAGGAPVLGVDRFDPMTGQFMAIGGLTARHGAQAAQLDGPIVVAGGMDVATNAPAPYVELVRSDRVERVDAPVLASTDFAFASLSDGRAFAFSGRDAGGVLTDHVVEVKVDGAGVEAGVVNTAHLAVPRELHVATRLSDDPGSPILITGGRDFNGNPVGTAELYKPLTEKFTEPAVPPAMLTPRYGHQAIRLYDGSVLVLGGIDATGTPVLEVELFQLDAGFAHASDLDPTVGVRGASLTTLPDGRLLLAGGLDMAGNPVDTAKIILLDPTGGVVHISNASDRLSTPRAYHQATLLCDGTVMFTGGTATPTPAERYNPASLGRR